MSEKAKFVRIVADSGNLFGLSEDGRVYVHVVKQREAYYRTGREFWRHPTDEIEEES
jgi:hypothetical protein